MSEKFKQDRRRFLETAALTIVGAQLGVMGAAKSLIHSTDRTEGKFIDPRVNDFGDNIKQINAGVLNVGFVDVGAATSPVVILLHGWPYDIYSFAEVTPLLMSK